MAEEPTGEATEPRPRDAADDVARGVPPGLRRAPAAQMPNAPAGPPAAPLRVHAFAAMRHRNFRIFYWGQLLSLTGTWMQVTAQGWLVLVLTDSALLLGIVTAASSAPVLLFTLYAGVVADRYDKRRIIIAAQAGALVMALALAVLTHAGLITYPLLLVIVFLLGTANAFEIPTRQSFFVDLVGKEDLGNAIALNSAAFSGTRIIGPAIAGVLIGTVGIAASFYVNALSYVGVLIALLMMRLPRFTPPERITGTLENLREGFAFIRSDRRVRTVVWLVAAMSVSVFPFVMLLPIFARDILDVGPTGFGWLMAASGAGALAGGMALAAWGSRMPRGRLILVSCSAFALFVAAFAVSRSFPLSMLLLAGAGFTMILNNATLNALLQALVPNRLRGRVMSVYVFMFLGMTPLGSLQAGAVARVLGAPAALLIGAAALLAVLAYIALRVPEVARAR